MNSMRLRIKAKFLFTFAFLLTTILIFAQSKTYKLGNLEVAEEDIPTNFNSSFDDAKKMIDELGEGWRMPSRSELDTLYKYREKVNMHPSRTYWSGEEYKFNVNNLVYRYVWGRYFGTGAKYFYHVNRQYMNARAVKTNNNDNK